MATKRSADDAGLATNSFNAKDIKLDGPKEDNFVWTPDYILHAIDEFKNLFKSIVLDFPSKEDQKIWYFMVPLQAGYEAWVKPDELEKIKAGVIKFQKQIHLALEEHTTNTGLKVWAPTETIKGKSCSINFSASDLENMVLGVEYMCPVDRVMKPGLLVDHITDLMAADPVKYFGDQDEALVDLEPAKIKKIMLKRYAAPKSTLPVLVGRAQVDQKDKTKTYPPGMKIKVKLHDILEIPIAPIFDKLDVEKAQAEHEAAVELAAANNTEGPGEFNPKPLYRVPYLSKDLAIKKPDVYEKNKAEALRQPDPEKALPKHSKMYCSVTLLGVMINGGNWGINSRAIQFFRTALTSGNGGRSGGADGPIQCHFLNKIVRKPALPAAAKPSADEATSSSSSSVAAAVDVPPTSATTSSE